MRSGAWCSLLAACLARTACGASDVALEREALFEAHIRPVLVGTCAECHGPNEPKSGLRADSRAGLIAGGKRGAAIRPGRPQDSLLIQAITHTHARLRMPPGDRLPDHVVAAFVTWIEQGAAWPSTARRSAGARAAPAHWAYQPLSAERTPRDSARWARNELDSWIARDHRRRELTAAAPASRRILIRRMYFDLLGLPPRPREIDAFVSDPAPDAVDRLLDRLLASPHFGQRWGRHWLDIARYADTAGDNADYPVPELYRYRDYVIDALNQDKPYDMFVREQLAGDILAARDPDHDDTERIVATGFLALSRRYATAPFELMHLTLEDTIETTGRAFLALTLRCARCHDHKYDPVTTEDYYALYGIFASTRFPYAGSEEFHSKQKNREGFIPLVPPAEVETATAAYDHRVRRLTAAIDEAREAGSSQQEIERLENKLRGLTRSGLPPDVPGAYAVSEGKPVDAHVQLQGDPGRAGPLVPRHVPGLVGGDDVYVSRDSSGRLELADWLVTAARATVARVMVNRLWQHHFGRGIVGTPSNFGRRGGKPTHPELLELLARRFVRSGWSIKEMHRYMMRSSTYRMASGGDPADEQRDPSNRFLWRFPRQRLDAEATRDAALAVSGLLDTRRPAAHPFPEINAWRWTQHDPFREVYPSRHRSVYLMTQRIQRHPFLALFDGPDTNTTTGTRSQSTVPLQSLYLMNSPEMVERSEAFANRLAAASADPIQRVCFAHRLAYGRPPSDEEYARADVFLMRYKTQLVEDGADASTAERKAWVAYARAILSANEFVMID